MKKIIIAGGSGFLGKLLAEYFCEQNYKVIVLSRSEKKIASNLTFVKWDGENLGDWTEELEGAEALINLCGKSVDCRYTTKNKHVIYDTRLKSTAILGEAIGGCTHPPKTWINSSSATIYRYAEDHDMDEETGEQGTGFSVDVCQKWEKTFFDADTHSTRKVVLRIAIVLGKKGGALHPLKGQSKIGLGGRQGTGQQYFSWIHETDFINAVNYIIDHNNLTGVYNLAAPNLVKNNQFMSSLRKSLNVPFGIPLSKLVLEIGARIIQTETELILKSRRVVPLKLTKSGFKFQYPYLEEALNDLL
jgi:uncharacterized protein